MNITVTLIVQMLVFAIFIWVVMTFIWPIILGAMSEREKKIAPGSPPRSRVRRTCPKPRAAPMK